MAQEFGRPTSFSLMFLLVSRWHWMRLSSRKDSTYNFQQEDVKKFSMLVKIWIFGNLLCTKVASKLLGFPGPTATVRLLCSLYLWQTKSVEQRLQCRSAVTLISSSPFQSSLLLSSFCFFHLLNIGRPHNFQIDQLIAACIHIQYLPSKIS